MECLAAHFPSFLLKLWRWANTLIDPTLQVYHSCTDEFLLWCSYRYLSPELSCFELIQISNQIVKTSAPTIFKSKAHLPKVSQTTVLGFILIHFQPVNLYM